MLDFDKHNYNLRTQQLHNPNCLVKIFNFHESLQISLHLFLHSRLWIWEVWTWRLWIWKVLTWSSLLVHHQRTPWTHPMFTNQRGSKNIQNSLRHRRSQRTAFVTSWMRSHKAKLDSTVLCEFQTKCSHQLICLFTLRGIWIDSLFTPIEVGI